MVAEYGLEIKKIVGGWRLGGQRNPCLSYVLIREERRLIPVNILCTKAIRV